MNASAAPRRRSKKGQSVPVKVMIEVTPPAPRKIRPPVELPPVPKPAAPAAQPTPEPTRPPPKKVTVRSSSPRLAPGAHLPETHRRKLMIVFVFVGFMLIVISWAALLPYQFNSGNQSRSLFRDIGAAFQNFSFNKKSEPARQPDAEIQRLSNRVFPQFTNQ